MRKTHASKAAAGFNLVELLTVLAILGLMTVIAVPPLATWALGLRVRMAAREMAAAMSLARAWSVRHNAYAGVKFRTDEDGTLTYALYRDGDGDGVLNQDIDAGIDPEIWAPRPLAFFDAWVRVGFPPGRAPRDPSDPTRRLSRLDDPIRFNRSDLAVFGPLGTATPGSIYVTGGDRYLSVVRTYHRTGKIQVLAYDLDDETWH